MKLIIWLSYLVLAAACFAILILSPDLGLGEKYEFILYRWVGLTRGATVNILLFFTQALVIYELLGLGIKASPNSPRFLMVLRSAWSDGSVIAAGLMDENRVSPSKKEFYAAASAIAALLVMFAVFLSKSLAVYKAPRDQHWWQALVSYGIEWKTPLFSFSGNLLNNFSIELPLKGNLLPIERSAHWFPIEWRLAAAVTILFLSAGVLFWIFGSIIGLKPVVRTVYAGLVSLLLTIPIGLDRIAWFLPPLFFTHQVDLALWWGEAPIVMLTTVLLFFLIGRFVHPIQNILAGIGFAVGTFLIVFAIAVGAVFFVPLTTAYCFGILLTAESRRELVWKSGAAALIALGMIVARAPQFLANLYDFTFSAYFYEFSADSPSNFKSDFLFASHINDLRGLLVYCVSFAAIILPAFKGKGAIRRLAIATLICECAIIVITAVNRWVWKVPLAGAYAELGHAPMWASFFVLSVIVVALLVDRRVVEWAQFAWRLYPSQLSFAVRNRRIFYMTLGVAVLGAYGLLIPRIVDSSDYPPALPPSVELLRRELAISPGSQFQGKLMTIVDSQSKGPTYLSDFIAIVDDRYRRYLGNDHYLDVLPYNIPILNPYGYLPSPETFAVSRVFFGREGEQFGRAWFLLTQFNLNMARLMGVRMVVTDAMTIPGGKLVYETKAGDADLRVFRIDNANLGQFSPTRVTPANTATEAIAAMKNSGFDPGVDVIVENELPDNLQSVKSVSLKVGYGPTLQVHASSNGRSLLVLPFEYSRCLKMKTTNVTGELIPVNIQQIGLLFENDIDAEITRRFGFFEESHCREEDKRRADRLKLKEMLILNNRASATKGRPVLW